MNIRQVIAIGGGRMRDHETDDIDSFLVTLTKKPSPKNNTINQQNTTNHRTHTSNSSNHFMQLKPS